MIAPLQGAIEDVSRLEEEIRRANDRRYAFYRMLHATDRVLFVLEDLNEADIVALPPDVGARVRAELRELPAACLELLVGGKVQELLDGVFSAQEALYRWRDPQWDPEGDGATPKPEPEPYAAADLERWADVCRWLESFGPQGLSKSVTPEKWADDLESMREHGLVFIRDHRLWRLHREWVARLGKLRARLEEG